MMRINTSVKMFLSLLLMGGACWAGSHAGSSAGCRADQAWSDSVEGILKRLRQRTAKTASYQAKVEYRYMQPLLESKSLRKGVLYYAKFGKRSKLRMNFQTLKQEDEKEQQYVEHFIFDGVWLTHIDYQLKAIKRYQVVEPNQPADAFELASKNLPIIGFTKIEDLKRQFEVKLVEPSKDDQKNLIHLHLKTKPGSVYKDQYANIDFWIDKKLGLPAKVVAVTTDPEPPFADVYQIKFLQPKVNHKIDEKLFEFTVPEDFGEPEIIPLNRKASRK